MHRGWIVIGLVGLVGCSDAGIKTVNTAPSAQITSHMNGDIVGADLDFTVVGLVSDVDDPTEDLQAGWMWGEISLCREEAPDESGISKCSLALPEGEAVVTLSLIHI